jgi:heat shock protein HslJ
MNVMWAAVSISIAMFSLSLLAESPKKIAVTGTLNRVMAIGAETSGWAVQLDSETTIGGQAASSIEIEYGNPQKLEKLNGKRIRAVGMLQTRTGVETNERQVLKVTSLKPSPAKAATKPVEPSPAPASLWGSEWVLEDLAGDGVVDRAQATLAFPQTGRVAGKGTCNRFSGTAEINVSNLKFGPLASTRMACPEALMNQESKYLAALQDAERFEIQDSTLLVYCKGLEKPLRFTKATAADATKSPN